MELSPTRMSEPEVSLRLAMALLSEGHTENTVEVFIDGAHVQTAGKVHFDLRAFMDSQGWRGRDPTGWKTTYTYPLMAGSIHIHSRRGLGDVNTRLSNGTLFIAHCKKGPLTEGRSQEFALLRGAIGQLMTMEIEPGDAVLAVAVPSSPKFEELVTRWRPAPLIRRAGIKLLTVAQDGLVTGW
jgi:hypothetical protein